MPPVEIFRTIALIVTDAQLLYNLIEEVYREGFFAKVFWRQFGHLANENAEPFFAKSIERIKMDCFDQITDMQVKYTVMLNEERQVSRDLRAKLEAETKDFTVEIKRIQEQARTEASIFHDSIMTRTRAKYEAEKADMKEALIEL